MVLNILYNKMGSMHSAAHVQWLPQDKKYLCNCELQTELATLLQNRFYLKDN